MIISVIFTQASQLVVANSVLKSATFKKHSGGVVTKVSETAAINQCSLQCLQMVQCMSFMLDEDKQHCELLQLQAELFTDIDVKGRVVVYSTGKSTFLV